MRSRRTSSKYLAVEAAGEIFAVAIDAVVRIATAEPVEGYRTLLQSGVLIGDDAVTVVDVAHWLERAERETPDREYFIQLQAPHHEAALRVSRVLEVFELADTEAHAAPTGSMGFGRGSLVGYSPMTKLSATLVRGALSANGLAFSYLAELGNLSFRNEKLWAGETLLNGDQAVVDRVKRETGYGCTIFEHNVRVSTTARRAGSQVRAIGSRAGADVSSLVLGSGREFRGVTTTIGRQWAIVYRPLSDRHHRVIGMLATFQEVSGRLFPLVDVGKLLESVALG